MKNPNKTIIIFISIFVLVILVGAISHSFQLKNDFKVSINFIVEKKERQANGFCHVFDKNGNELPLKSFLLHEGQVNEGDSIVKKSNSYIVNIYRKRNYLYVNGDNKYFVVEKIKLDKK